MTRHELIGAGNRNEPDPYDAMIARSIFYGWVMVVVGAVAVVAAVGFWAVGAATERPDACQGLSAAECSAAVVGEL